MELYRKISSIYNNSSIMRVASHYFLTMLGIYCVQDNYFKTLKDTVGDDAAEAFNLNLTASLSFFVSLMIAVIVKMFNDHRIVIVIQYLLFIASLIIECFIYKMKNKFLAYLSVIFYNIGQGTLFTTLDFMKINSLTISGSLHLVTIISIGASFGQMGGLIITILFAYLEKNEKECRQKLRFVAIVINIICILMSIFFNPKCDYNLKAIEGEKNKKKSSISKNTIGLIKLLITPSYILFLLGILLQCGVQKNIKLLQRDFITKMGASEISASIGQFLNRFLSILVYLTVIYITSEKMIFNYFFISCLLGTFRSFMFLYISWQKQFSWKYQAIIIPLYSIEDGLQNLSISRICNFLSPNYLKIYSQGVYIGTKNSLSILISTLINKYINNNSSEMTMKIYSNIWITMTSMAGVAVLISILLLLLNRKK